MKATPKSTSRLLKSGDRGAEFARRRKDPDPRSLTSLHHDSALSNINTILTR